MKLGPSWKSLLAEPPLPRPHHTETQRHQRPLADIARNCRELPHAPRGCDSHTQTLFRGGHWRRPTDPVRPKKLSSDPRQYQGAGSKTASSGPLA